MPFYPFFLPLNFVELRFVGFWSGKVRAGAHSDEMVMNNFTLICLSLFKMYLLFFYYYGL